MNGGFPGPLLATDPADLCGDDCINQEFGSSSKNWRDATVTRPAAEIDVIPDKGPLLTIAMALFGQGSFLANRAQHPSAYTETPIVDPDSVRPWPINSGACNDLAPLANLLDGRYCIWNSDLHSEVDAAGYVIAAFLANKARLEHGFGDYQSLTVYYDMGADTRIPEISTAGVVVVSVLMGLHVAVLLALGIYAAWSPR
ncbi:hypothetical protein BJX61DRAFT_546660 [Aspergillus egyptiacus]|nr:hypothetical protein BJX61DRAFT_546660 [Aspergillus egyptiacus]